MFDTSLVAIRRARAAQIGSTLSVKAVSRLGSAISVYPAPATHHKSSIDGGGNLGVLQGNPLGVEIGVSTSKSSTSKSL